MNVIDFHTLLGTLIEEGHALKPVVCFWSEWQEGHCEWTPAHASINPKSGRLEIDAEDPE